MRFRHEHARCFPQDFPPVGDVVRSDVAAFDKLQLFSLVGVAGILELVGGVLLLLGLFTRPVAFVLCGEMAFAYFIGHAPKGFWPATNGGGMAILYCWLFLYIAAQGPGAWALDNLRRKALPSTPR